MFYRSCCKKAEVSRSINSYQVANKEIAVTKHDKLNKIKAMVEPVISKGKLIKTEFLQ